MKIRVLLALTLSAAASTAAAQSTTVPPELVRYPELILLNGQVLNGTTAGDTNERHEQIVEERRGVAHRRGEGGVEGAELQFLP